MEASLKPIKMISIKFLAMLLLLMTNLPAYGKEVDEPLKVGVLKFKDGIELTLSTFLNKLNESGIIRVVSVEKDILD